MRANKQDDKNGNDEESNDYPDAIAAHPQLIKILSNLMELLITEQVESSLNLFFCKPQFFELFADPL
jgi:hypothetical protein